jgi:hypothetical protein
MLDDAHCLTKEPYATMRRVFGRIWFTLRYKGGGGYNWELCCGGTLVFHVSFPRAIRRASTAQGSARTTEEAGGRALDFLAMPMTTLRRSPPAAAWRLR